MGKPFENFKKLKTAQKISVVIATIATAAVVIGLPVFAWFSAGNTLETLTKVKEPDSLDIRAGHYHSIINFELKDIDLESLETNGKAEYRVFSVNAGDYKIPYIIQLAHTTNIPLKYSLYYAKELESGETATESSVAYKPIYKDPEDTTADGTIYYYNIDTDRSAMSPTGQINLTLCNGDAESESYYGRTLAKTNDYYYGMTYVMGSDTPEIYAVPLYWQSEIISPTDDETGGIHDYYILKIEWDSEAAATNFTKWNRAENNKETDIIYISASRATN